MNNTKLLIKASIINSFGLNKFLKESSKAEKAKMIFIGVAILWAFIAVFALSFAYSYMVSEVLLQLDSLNILLVIAFLNVSVISFFMSIYKASGYLFSFKDYDLLMSLPVRTSEVFISKLLLLYTSNLIVTIIIGIPPLIVYGIKSSSIFMYYVFALVAMIFIPFIPIIIGSVLSFILGKISTRFKFTNLVMIIGSFALILILMLGSFSINNISTEFIQSSAELMSSISKVYFPIIFFVNALEKLEALSLLLYILSGLIPFIIFLLIFVNSFKNINSKMNESFKEANYKMSSLKVSSSLKALYKKEINFYFSSYIYVVNTGIGVIMMTIFTLSMAILGGEKLAQVLEMPMISQFMIPAAIAIMSVCICLSCTTASSISLEGKNLWIVKSLPIKIVEIIISKILVNLTVVLPLLFVNSLILAISFRLTLISYIFFLAIPTLYAFLISMAGIIVNLLLPKLEWKSHMVVVKQSASVVVTMLIGILSILIPIFLFFLTEPTNFNTFSFALAIILLGVNLLLWLIIKTKGIKIFAKL